MKIVLTGGGSGGHITPLLAVAHEIHKLKPEAKIIYIGQRGDGLADMLLKNPDVSSAFSISAGKFRRYHGLGVRQLLKLPTHARNARDIFRCALGVMQSWLLLKKLRPDAIFIKGGFVGLPVGLAAAWLRIPYVTHDSDAIPGLTNRIIARWAAAHAVALPEEAYDYPKNKTFTVGVPVSSKFQEVDEYEQARLRKELGLEARIKILLITGGGLGARRINDAVIEIAHSLLERYEDLMIIHLTGHKNLASVEAAYKAKLEPAFKKRLIVKDFVEDLYRYSGAADVIVARAGATNIAEFALQAKACIIVPNPYLAGGHQLKNAALLSDEGAALVVREDALDTKPDELEQNICTLLDSSAARENLCARIKTSAHPKAAHDLAVLIIKEIKK